MNKYVERLYNGIWKENPIFVQIAGSVSDPGGNHFRHQRCRHGTFDNRRTDCGELSDCIAS